MNESLIPIQQTAIAATDDDHVIDLWLEKQRSAATREIYGQVAREFRDFLKLTPLRQITLDGVLSYRAHLATQHAPGTQAKKLAAVKSLLTFAHLTGYTRFNVGRAVSIPRVKDTRAERIMCEEDVFKLISGTERERDKLLIRVLYVCAGRVSEVVGASWRDLQERAEGGQITLYGKGDKTRAVLLPPRLWNDLAAFRGNAQDDDPLFASREGRLSRSQAWRIVKKAAKLSGVSWETSPHWLRHAHASHALENGATVKLVSETLGHSSVAVTSRYLHARPGESSSQHLKVG